jgi:serine/threonine protein kinase
MNTAARRLTTVDGLPTAYPPGAAISLDQPIRVRHEIHGYRVRRKLGSRPGLAVTVEASARDGHLVSLTLFAPGLTPDRERRRRALRLARLRASIKHPNLLPILAVFEERGGVALVTELTARATLADRLRVGPLGRREAVRILDEVAGGLEAAAAERLVHRDLAPAGVVFNEAGRALLTDFGIALPTSPGSRLPVATDGVQYRAPEVIRGEPVSPQSNVYSLACILVECLVAAPPFPNDRPLLTLHAHVVEPPPRVSKLGTGLPRAIDDVIAIGMAKDPGARQRSPSELVRGAADALGVAPGSSGERSPARLEPRPSKPAPPRHEPARRRQEPARGQREAAGRRPERTRHRATRRRTTSRRLGWAHLWIAAALAVSAAAGFAIGTPEASSPNRSATAAAGAAKAAAERVAREERGAYVRSVARAVDQFERRRARAGRALLRARRPTGQAAKAGSLATAVRELRRALPAPPPGFSEVRLEARVRDVELAYRDLARAARRRNERAWTAGRRAATRAETRLEAALGTLGSTYDQLERRSVARSSQWRAEHERGAAR